MNGARGLAADDAGQQPQVQVTAQDVSMTRRVQVIQRQVYQVGIGARRQAVQLNQAIQVVVAQRQEVEQALHAVAGTRGLAVVVSAHHNDAVILVLPAIVLTDAASQQKRGIVQPPENVSLAFITWQISLKQHPEARHDIVAKVLEHKHQRYHCGQQVNERIKRHVHPVLMERRMNSSGIAVQQEHLEGVNDRHRHIGQQRQRLVRNVHSHVINHKAR